MRRKTERRSSSRGHLHAPPAPPALAPRILPHLTCSAPPSSPPAASLAPGRPANNNANAPNTNGAHKGPLARLAPDPHAKRGWHRVRSHNAEVEALAGKILAAERAGRGRVRVPPGLEGSASASGDGREGRAALRVLRIAVACPMHEAGAGAGGRRVGRAVGGVLARASRSGDKGEEEGEGLVMHVFFGAHVKRRTIEKVLRTLGAGVGEGLAVQNAATTDGTRIAKGAPGFALLEVRSTVRAAELYKVMHAVLPRFPAPHTLLLTRPPALYPPRPAEPPSPRSPSLFFLSPPATPGFPPPPAVPHARTLGQALLSLVLSCRDLSIYVCN
ncbi:hypothetical protein DFH09DRAFT_1309504 [Mycena vulgaris]|nr:hypothetical protein DFH09DRAFT_1309504 [Mycena vulgaris]